MILWEVRVMYNKVIINCNSVKISDTSLDDVWMCGVVLSECLSLREQVVLGQIKIGTIPFIGQLLADPTCHIQELWDYEYTFIIA